MSIFSSFVSSLCDVASQAARLANDSFNNGDNQDDDIEWGYDSPTSWERHPWETDEDYQERMEGQVSMMGGD